MGKHFRLETDNDHIAWLSFDKDGSSTNVLNLEVFAELEQHLDALEQQPPKGLVIRSAKDNGFIAGADIEAFTQITDAQEAMTLLETGQHACNRIERLPCPTVALIHGFCLGGGLELALACRYRVARDDPGTRLGLPEVRLGIHPGWGGSARLVPLIGAVKAMDLILSGRTVDGRGGRRMGFVDLVVAERHLRAGARKLLLETPPPHRASLLERLSNSAPVRPLLARLLRRQVAQRVSARHYPAPFAMIDLWRRHAGSKSAMLRAERESLAQLVRGLTARNLVRVYFLQEQLKALGKDRDYQPRHVHVVGAGTMGGDIAAWCALRGFYVTLQDQSPERIAPALARAYKLYTRKLKRPARVRAAMDRLQPDHRGTGVRHADLVIEAIFEDAEVKRSLYKDIEPKMKPDAILATNTSSIPLEELSPALQHPERLVGLHFFNPVAKMMLVEIVNGETTSPQVSARAMTFTRRIDRLPLPVRSTPGFLVNRILMPYLMEAVELEAEGVPALLIDQAATRFGMPMGPVELADTVGLDICLHVAEVLARHYPATIPASLRQLVASGRLGRKSGQGYYTWKKGRAVKPAAGSRQWNMDEITNRLVLRLLNEAVRCLREQVVATADLLDAGMIFATGFAPFRGGPVNHIHAQGKDRLLQQMHDLQKLRGERFAPDPGWQELE
jgi:3-hydroxyacyl-CoA dehydrogenase/enoyl-CoA hydratase/3-hydroxybutyryl-CoA epimerase